MTAWDLVRIKETAEEGRVVEVDGASQTVTVLLHNAADLSEAQTYGFNQIEKVKS